MKFRDITPLDLDEILDRIFIDQVGKNPWDRNGMNKIHQEAFTLTSIDPNRLNPAIECGSERLKNLTLVCRMKGIEDDTINWLTRECGFKSLTHLSFLDLRDIAIKLEFPPRESWNTLENFLEELKHRRPLEPLYSLKRYFEKLKTDRDENEKEMKRLEFLDLAIHAKLNVQNDDPYSIDRFRESYNDAAEVLRKLVFSTFKPDKPVLKPVSKPPSSSGYSSSAGSRSDSCSGSSSIGYFSSRSSSPGSSPKMSRPPRHHFMRKHLDDRYHLVRAYPVETISPQQRKRLGICHRCNVMVTECLVKRYCRPCFDIEKKSFPFKCRRCHFRSTSQERLQAHSLSNCEYERSFCPWPRCQFFGTLCDIAGHLFNPKDHEIQRTFIYGTSLIGNHPEMASFTLSFPNCEDGWFDPQSFVFNGRNFHAILVERKKLRDGKMRKRFVFWIYSVATPKVTENYQYSLVVPYIHENVPYCVERFAVVNSVQKSARSIMNEKWDNKKSAGVSFNGFAFNHNKRTHNNTIHYKLTIQKTNRYNNNN